MSDFEALRISLNKETQGATVDIPVKDVGDNYLELTFEELVQLHTQVSDVWRLAHAARRTEQAKEDLI